jgi:hypothetical protein
MRPLSEALAAALAVALILPAVASADELGAEAIANKVYAEDFMAFSTGIAQVRMTLTNKRGQNRVRRILSKSRSEDGLRHTIVRFLSPPDIQGTAFLLVEQKDRADDQWLYLPALKRTRRIAGTQKSGSFMGSDFTYADMESRDVGKHLWKKLADEKVGSADCYHLESTPRDPKDEAYARSEIWVHKETWLPLKVKFFDKRGAALLKTLFIEEFKKIEGRFLVTKAVMRNTKKGSSTRLEVESIDLKTEVPASALTVEALPKG